MKQQTQQIEEPTEYFLPSQIEFKFCWSESFNDGNFAERIVEESKK